MSKKFFDWKKKFDIFFNVVKNGNCINNTLRFLNIFVHFGVSIVLLG